MITRGDGGCELRENKTHPIHIQRLQAQDIHEVLLARPVAPPLAHLAGRQVVRRVDVSGAPPPRHLPREVVLRPLRPQVLVYEPRSLRAAAVSIAATATAPGPPL